MTNVFEQRFLDRPLSCGSKTKENENEREHINDEKDLGTLFLKDKMK